MCLILFSYNEHPKYKAIIAANRDEFFDRESQAADFWIDNKDVLAGRDMTSRGTWLGLHRNGKFIAITNYRDLDKERTDAKSRGELSRKFLMDEITVDQLVDDIRTDKDAYNGFNLLLSDDGFQSMYHYSNINDKITTINNGIHGLSNELLNSPWPKVVDGKDSLKEIASTNSFDAIDLINMLKNGKEAPDEALPDTGISFELEKKLSPVFISMKGYGTRCSTAILIDYKGNVSFTEISYDENKEVFEQKNHNMTFSIQ